MSLQFHRVALVGKYQDSASSAVPDSTREIIAEIAGFLTAQGCQVVLAERTAHSTGLDQYPALDVATIGNECDLAVVVGGDGTMLGIGRQLARYGTPLIGINQGRLGFMTDIARSDMLASMDELFAGRFIPENRMLLDAEVLRGSQNIASSLALNEVVVDKGAIGRLIEFELFIDGEFIYNLRSDGLILSTPTG